MRNLGCLKSESDKISILRNISKLCIKENPENVKNIFISPDLTPKEQKVNKALCLQLKELNKDESVIR